MGIFRSVSDSICAVADTVTRSASAVGESVDIANVYVNNRAQKFKAVDTSVVMAEAAEALQEVRAKLNADEDLNSIYEELKAEWK